MTPTQSPTLASQATAELPKLPEPLIWRWRNTQTGGQGFHPIKGYGNPEHAHIYKWDAVFTADQMNAHYLAGVEAGRASRAQSEWQPIETAPKTTAASTQAPDEAGEAGEVKP